MKKLLSILLSIAMVTLLLTGCGKTEITASSGTGGSTPTGEKTDILLWLPPYAAGGEALDQKWWTETLASWAEENNVNLTIEITPPGAIMRKNI